ncbi:MAG: hypothetical protein JSV53_02575 [candidate division WOR-3 bacterium]|nr:MAG: hypothetical protein JSV53_02575 [candidate division WOR-3 bacterium]
MFAYAKIKVRLKDTVLIGFTLAFVVLLASAGCKDPDEYDPNEPLDPPPAPPTLLYPLPDTNLCSSSPFPLVFFDWNTVGGAEIYQLQTDSLITFETAELLQYSYPPTYVQLYRYEDRATYYARIRAGSTRWTNYTEWSEVRRFYLRPDP